jgi:hypothetical protein
LSSGETPENLAGEAVAESAAEDAATPERQARHRRWVPLGIVLVSVLAAVMGWRASIAEEHSNHDNELARQDLVRQQQLQLGDLLAANSDVRLFGSYEQTSLLAQALRSQARHAQGTQADDLKRQAASNVTVAQSLYGRLSGNALPRVNVDSTFDPSAPYDLKAERAALRIENDELAALDPDRLRNNARAERNRGVQLTGLAALFVVAIVLFTLAAVGLSSALFAISGAVVGAVALILFITIEVV